MYYIYYFIHPDISSGIVWKPFPVGYSDCGGCSKFFELLSVMIIEIPGSKPRATEATCNSENKILKRF